MGRRFIGALTAILVAMVTIAIVEAISMTIVHPSLPQGTKDVSGLGALLLVIVIGWGIGTWAGVRVGGLIAPTHRKTIALVVPVFVLAGTIVNLIQIHHPVWVWIAAPISIIGAARLALVPPPTPVE